MDLERFGVMLSDACLVANTVAISRPTDGSNEFSSTFTFSSANRRVYPLSLLHTLHPFLVRYPIELFVDAAWVCVYVCWRACSASGTCRRAHWKEARVHGGSSRLVGVYIGREGKKEPSLEPDHKRNRPECLTGPGGSGRSGPVWRLATKSPGV